MSTPLPKSVHNQVAQAESQDKSQLGFWIYLMTDCVLFASLFATYAVLRHNTYGGPSAHELFRPGYALIETLLLLTSSFTCGLMTIAVRQGKRQLVVMLLIITGLLGLVFLGMEISEFHKLAVDGDSWRRSGFLSAFFTLVGTHGLHILSGLLWLTVLLWNSARRGLTTVTSKRLLLFSLFWHFLDLVWIFIFTFVYMLGVLGA